MVPSRNVGCFSKFNNYNCPGIRVTVGEKTFKKIYPQNNVYGTEISRKSVCYISRSLSDNEKKQARYNGLNVLHISCFKGWFSLATESESES